MFCSIGSLKQVHRSSDSSRRDSRKRKYSQGKEDEICNNHEADPLRNLLTENLKKRGHRMFSTFKGDKRRNIHAYDSCYAIMPNSPSTANSYLRMQRALGQNERQILLHPCLFPLSNYPHLWPEFHFHVPPRSNKEEPHILSHTILISNVRSQQKDTLLNTTNASPIQVSNVSRPPATCPTKKSTFFCPGEPFDRKRFDLIIRLSSSQNS